MRSKCTNCGLVNFPNESSCKRCKSALGQALECNNVWRDGKRLVLSRAEHLMPERCLKCGTTDNLQRWDLQLTYTPLSAYATTLLSFTYWTNYTFYGFLCTAHRRFAERETLRMLPTIFVVVGPGCILFSLVADDPFLRMLLFFGGAAMLGLGILFIKATAGALKVVKRNKRHIWIQGVDQDLLAQLEDFAVSKR